MYRRERIDHTILIKCHADSITPEKRWCLLLVENQKFLNLID